MTALIVILTLAIIVNAVIGIKLIILHSEVSEKRFTVLLAAYRQEGLMDQIARNVPDDLLREDYAGIINLIKTV